MYFSSADRKKNSCSLFINRIMPENILTLCAVSLPAVCLLGLPTLNFQLPTWFEKGKILDFSPKWTAELTTLSSKDHKWKWRADSLCCGAQLWIMWQALRAMHMIFLETILMRCRYISREQMQMKGSTDNKFPSVQGSCPHSEVGIGICLSWVSSEHALKAWTQLSRKSERIAGQLICLYRLHLALMSCTCMHMIFVRVDKCLV